MSVYIFLWGAVVVFGFIASRSNYKAKYFVLFSFFLMTEKETLFCTIFIKCFSKR